MSVAMRQRSIEGEGNLAARIAMERERRGLSYEALAKLMTDAGCKMQGSSIYKIEKADPPRRITVDELLAFARVFSLDVENLLTPLGLVNKERAKQIISELDTCRTHLADATGRLVTVLRKCAELVTDDPDLYRLVTEGIAEPLFPSWPLGAWDQLPEALRIEFPALGDVDVEDAHYVPLAAALAEFVDTVSDVGFRQALPEEIRQAFNEARWSEARQQHEALTAKLIPTNDSEGGN